MAFTGTPTVVQLNDQTVRITGITLAALASGTIGLTGATGTPPDITLPATFRALAYTYQSIAVGLQDAINVTINPVSSAVVVPARTNLQPSVAKTGTAVTDFRITVTNTNDTLETQTLEILIRTSRPRTGIPGQLA